MKRIYNFSAGPATLPIDVLQEVQADLIDYKGMGMSIMEMSHRSKTFESVLQEAKTLVRSLYGIDDSYEVLFLQGGASMQFSMVPLNFLQKNTHADVIETGVWVQKAIKEFKKVGDVSVVASASENNYRAIPELSKDLFHKDAAFAYLCSNNTIYGTQYQQFPDIGHSRLVADMSSDIMSRPLDISKFSLIFAGAQKNLGPAGVTLVLIKKSWLDLAVDPIASMLSYKTHAKADSMYNTSPVFPIYVLSLYLKWVQQMGGLDVMQANNAKKSQLLYDFIDSNPFYYCPVEKNSRSHMNVVFRINGDNQDLEAAFVKQAEESGLSGLKGHRLVGGLRASIYNAFDIKGIEALISFMSSFEKKYA